jgi:hypothetical protein
MGNEYNELVAELDRVVRELKENQARIELAVGEVERRLTDMLNASYSQGARDAAKARTGRDPKVENDRG